MILLSESNGEADVGRFDPRDGKQWHIAATVEDILNALPEAVYTTDANGRITFFNDAAAAMWGVSPVIGTTEFCGSWKLYWPDGTPMAHADCPIALALKDKRAIRGLEAI